MFDRIPPLIRLLLIGPPPRPGERARHFDAQRYVLLLLLTSVFAVCVGHYGVLAVLLCALQAARHSFRISFCFLFLLLSCINPFIGCIIAYLLICSFASDHEQVVLQVVEPTSFQHFPLRGGSNVIQSSYPKHLSLEETEDWFYFRASKKQKKKLDGRLGAGVITGTANEIINAAQKVFITDVDTHLYGTANGLCGFFAFGAAMNNQMLGNTNEWIQAVYGADLATGLASQDRDIDQLASRFYRNFSAYYATYQDFLNPLSAPNNAVVWQETDPGVKRAGAYTFDIFSSIQAPGSNNYSTLNLKRVAIPQINGAKDLYRIDYELIENPNSSGLIVCASWMNHFTVVLPANMVAPYRAPLAYLHHNQQKGQLSGQDLDALRNLCTGPYTCTNLNSSVVFPSYLQGTNKPEHPMNTSYASYRATILASKPAQAAGVSNTAPAPIPNPTPTTPPASTSTQSQKASREVFNFDKITYTRPSQFGIQIKTFDICCDGLDQRWINKNRILQHTLREMMLKFSAIEKIPVDDRTSKENAAVRKLNYPVNYPHINLRLCSDLVFTQAIADAYNKKLIDGVCPATVLYDIGSKWNKVQTWINDNFPGLQLAGARPDDNAYDMIYWETHKSTAPANMKRGYANSKDIPKNSIVTANDCIWYPGVLETLIDAAQHSLVRATFPIYSNQPGTHKYSTEDEKGKCVTDEGEYTVFFDDGLMKIRNNPKDNDVKGGYVHNAIQMCLEDPGQYVLQNGKNYAGIKILSKYSLSPFNTVTQVCVEFVKCAKTSDTITAEQFRTIRDPPKKVNDIHELKNPDSMMVPQVIYIESEQYSSNNKNVAIKAELLELEGKRQAARWFHMFNPKPNRPMSKRQYLIEKAKIYQRANIAVEKESYLKTEELEMITFDRSALDYLTFIVANMPISQITTRKEKLHSLRLWYAKTYPKTSTQWQQNKAFDTLRAYEQVCVDIEGFEKREDMTYFKGDHTVTDMFFDNLYYILPLILIFLQYCFSTKIKDNVIFKLFIPYFKIVVPFLRVVCSVLLPTALPVINFVDNAGEAAEKAVQITETLNSTTVNYAMDTRREEQKYSLVGGGVPTKTEKRRAARSRKAARDNLEKEWGKMFTKQDFDQDSDRCRHICKAVISKLEPREMDFVRNLTFYKLEDVPNVATQGSHLKAMQKHYNGEIPQSVILEWKSGADIYNYYEKFCTCHKNVITQYDKPSVRDGVRSYNYTFGTCPLNHIASLLARHLYTTLYPENNTIAQFKDFIEGFVKHTNFIPMWLEEVKRQKISIADYIESIKMKDATKGELLARGFKGVLLGKSISLLLKTFTKVGEWQKAFIQRFVTQELRDEQELEGRPRQIWGPSVELKTLPGWVNRAFLYALKKMFPVVICGYSDEQLAEKITKDRARVMAKWGSQFCSVFTFDGSSHDSHQHYKLIYLVDVFLFSLCLPTFYDFWHVPECLRVECNKPILELWFPAECTIKVGGKTLLLYSLEIQGTTFSGHPTRTTLGNSLRVLFFILFLLFISCSFGYLKLFSIMLGMDEDMVIYVAGDDVMIFGATIYIDKLAAAIRHTHAPDVNQGMWGLGQCARESALNDYTFVDFLSRDGYLDGTKFKVVRKLDRLVNDGNMSKKLPKHGTIKESVFHRLISTQKYMIGAVMKLMTQGLSYPKLLGDIKQQKTVDPSQAARYLRLFNATFKDDFKKFSCFQTGEFFGDSTLTEKMILKNPTQTWKHDERTYLQMLETKYGYVDQAYFRDMEMTAETGIPHLGIGAMRVGDNRGAK